MQAELSTFLGCVNLRLSWWRQELKILHQTPQSNAENWQGQDDSGAAPSADAERKVAEVIAVGLDLGFLLQEALGAELLRVLPVGRVVGEPPGVDEDLALCGDVVAAELGFVEVHVGDKERDGHAQPQGFLDHGLQVRQLEHVWLGDLHALSKDSV